MDDRQENILEIRDLCKEYPDFRLNHINLALPKGSVMGLVGANGAGKSTTIKLILNLIRRSAGEIRLFGMDNIADESAVKQRIGVVFDECFFHDNLRPMQVSRVMSGIYRGWDEGYYRELLGRFSLPEKKTVRDFSRGMKMKLSIAAAMAHHPDLLILDEPTSGLDPIVRGEILDLFLDFIQDENKGILLSSHITSDLEKIADYITFIDKGEVLLSGEKDALVEGYGMIKGPVAAVERLAEEDVLGLEITRHGFAGLVADREAAAAKYPDFILDNASLEDIIVCLVRGNRT